MNLEKVIATRGFRLFVGSVLILLGVWDGFVCGLIWYWSEHLKILWYAVLGRCQCNWYSIVFPIMVPVVLGFYFIVGGIFILSVTKTIRRV